LPPETGYFPKGAIRAGPAGDLQALLHERRSARAAIELACPGGGDQRFRARSDIHLELEAIATDYAPRRVKKIKMTDTPSG
jgi:hypothetical protein